MSTSRCLAILALSAVMATGSIAAHGAQAPSETHPEPHASTHSAEHPDPSASALAGGWRLAATDDEEQERLRAIEALIQRLPAIARARARSRLMERTVPPPTLEIEIEGTRLLLTSDSGRVEIALDGPPTELSGRRETARMSARMEQDSLKIEAQGSRGGRTTTYSTDGARLMVRTTLRGDRLPAALTYATTYVRSE